MQGPADDQYPQCNVLRFGLAIVEIVQFGKLRQYRSPVAGIKPQLSARTDDLLRWDLVNLLGTRPYEVDSTTRDDVCFEAVRPQEAEQV